MRPVSLTIEGMTAFRERQVLDLRDLGLFCVTGPTGAGKTTIFDAISFALYGKVHRVSNRVRSLIATGSAEVCVELDFTVAGERHRVARRITRAGGRGGGRHDARLERREGSAWAGTHSGAEPVNLAVEQLTGLDFHAFTRAAMLPQGEFARFLTGDAGERRRILVGLLDLARVERAGPRARVHAEALRSQERVLRDTVAREGDAADDATIAAAEQAVTHAEQVAAQRTRAAEEARRSAEKAAEETRTARRLDGLTARLDDLQRRTEALAAQRTSLDARHEVAASARVAAEDALRNAVERRTNAEHERDRLARETGSAADLAMLSETDRSRRAALDEGACIAQEIATATREQETLRATHVESKATYELAREAAAAVALTAEREAATRAETTRAEHSAAADRLRALEVQHAAAALRHDLSHGDDCPVCERAVDGALPAAPADLSQRLAHARAALGAAEAALAASGAPSAEVLGAAQQATAALDAARARDTEVSSALRVAEAHLQGLSRAAEAAAIRAQEATTRLEAGIGSPLPDDVDAHLRARRDAIDAAEAAVAQASIHLATAQAAADKTRQDGAEVDTERARIDATFAALEAEVRTVAAEFAQAVEGVEPAADAPAPDGETPAETVARHAYAVRARAAEVLRAAEQRTAGVEALLHSAGIPATVGAADALEAAARDAAAEHAKLGAQLSALHLRRDQARERQARADTFAREAVVLETLANHLKSDRFVEFLLTEHVEEIVQLASAHLMEISAGRYSLEVESSAAGAFHVVDHHNADERRGVITLSGGETFQASLALALALSEGLANLSGDSRLDAVFIDEGFASLDAESLDLAIDALESVHAGGRMVGVITHVPQMAERIPDGLEVLKGEAGSQVVRRAA